MVDTSLLRDVPLLTELSEEEMATIEAATSATDLLRGDLLFAEGETPTHLHVVVNGRVAISKRSVDGRESMVALMERGDVLGEMSLFDGLGRSAEARALEPSQVLTIPFEPLRAIYENRPALLWSVVHLLVSRLRSTDTALADSVFLDVTGRTAKRLLELAGEDDEFVLPITQEELAGMVGASRERVNKAIASFVRLGWIEQQDRRYHIVNRTELSRRSR